MNVPCTVCGQLRPFDRRRDPLRLICHHCRINRLCQRCGEVFTRTTRAGRKCCYRCVPIKTYDAQRLHTCKHCESPFQAMLIVKGRGIRNNSARTYCDTCVTAQVWKWSPLGPKRCGGHSARARRYGVEYECIDRLRVFDRDGWRCGICRTKVDRRLKSPHPMSPSLDHIVPMSVGGGHAYSNVQCAHLRCNVTKGNRGHGEQLALIG